MNKTLALTKITSHFFIFVSILFLFFAPFLVFAEDTGASGGFVYECSGKPGECDFNDLIGAVQKAVTWGSTFAIAFSVVVIAYAGFMYMTSGANPGQRTKANEMLKKVAIGISLILAAWLIVSLITNSLLTDNLKNDSQFNNK